MFEHRDIWGALDRLAIRHGMSVSGLAKQAGLDPTTFNKSKRQSVDGKPRWPSTESLSKVLNVMRISFDDFATLVSLSSGRTAGLSVPVIGLAQAGSDGFFDDAGFPVGSGWDEVRIPGLSDENVYALEISGDSMAPVLRAGDRVLIAPNEEVRKGDRVVVKTISGEVMAKELKSITKTRVELISINPDYEDRTFDRLELVWIARIVWASH